MFKYALLGLNCLTLIQNIQAGNGPMMIVSLAGWTACMVWIVGSWIKDMIDVNRMVREIKSK